MLTLIQNFYPRSPCGERPYQGQIDQQSRSISIHALLAESDRFRAVQHPEIDISIHALLAESDKTLVILAKELDNFYPRSPCGERQSSNFGRISIHIFLSTLSLRRATMPGGSLAKSHLHFYPRSPCGERLENPLCQVVNRSISIHALLAESDPAGRPVGPPQGYFYPRSPCGERRHEYNIVHNRYGISIHALLAESDRHLSGYPYQDRQFLSTLSLRRATCAGMRIASNL